LRGVFLSKIKSNILAPPNLLATQNFWAGYATDRDSRNEFFDTESWNLMNVCGLCKSRDQQGFCTRISAIKKPDAQAF